MVLIPSCDGYSVYVCVFVCESVKWGSKDPFLARLILAGKKKSCGVFIFMVHMSDANALYCLF
jgi:hypothetical protein